MSWRRAGQKLAARTERLSAAEELASRLAEERAELERREMALRQQETSIAAEDGDFDGAEPGNWHASSKDCSRKKTRLAARQQELEQEWEAARTRLTQMEDHLRMGRQSLQEMREQT